MRRIKDQALMEWVGNRVFQARIFPFDPDGERTLTLSYSVVLPREGDFHVYNYLSGQGSMTDHPGLIARPERPVPPEVSPRPPMPRQMQGATGRTARFTVEGTLRSDRAIRSVYSPTHALAVEQDDPTEAHFSAEGALRNRDGFKLYYAVAEEEDVGFSLLTHRPPGEDGYFLLRISPGWRNGHTRSARNVVFVLDVSGSMEGDRKLQQAQEALGFGLSTLGDEDRFAVVTYSSTVRSWRPGMTVAGRDEVEAARAFVAGLTAGGGTNIEGALRTASDLARGADGAGNGRSGVPTYVVFLTDGLPTVGVEDPDALLGITGERMPGGTRLFTWGVGYDVNAFLLDRLAGEHGGRAAYVEPSEDLEAKVSSFFGLISTPVLVDLELDIAGGDLYDVFPERLPDLFQGTDVTVMGRFRGSGNVQVRLTGTERSRPRRISRRVDLPGRAWDAGFLAPMWAQRKVGYLLEQIRLHGESEELKSEIIELGERYGIVTPFTAYLVIEEQMRISESMADEAMAPAMDAVRSIARESRRAQSASVYAGAAGARQQVGNEAIAMSKVESMMQDSDAFQRLDFLSVQQVGIKTFRLDQADGVWKDREALPEQQVKRVEVGSQAFLDLLDSHRELARYAALGPKIQVVLDGQLWQIELPEEGNTR